MYVSLLKDSCKLYQRLDVFGVSSNISESSSDDVIGEYPHLPDIL